MTPRKRIQMHFDVATDDQAAELSAAYEEVVSGKRTRISTAATCYECQTLVLNPKRAPA